MRQWLSNSFWTASWPVWVSRKTADGMIMNLSVPGWLFMLLGTLGILNAVVWGFLGLYEAVRIVF